MSTLEITLLGMFGEILAIHRRRPTMAEQVPEFADLCNAIFRQSTCCTNKVDGIIQLCSFHERSRLELLARSCSLHLKSSSLWVSRVTAMPNPCAPTMFAISKLHRNARPETLSY